MANTDDTLQEYIPYDARPDHLTERQAVDAYEKLRQANPEALVVIKDLDCGHWQVTKYVTEVEKMNHLYEVFARRMKEISAVFSRLPIK